MSDRLETRNGESVTIDSILEALERAPSKEEVVEALRGLRHDKVKNALGETVKAAQFDLAKVLNEFLADGEKAERTRQTYRAEIQRFLAWIEREQLHIFQVRRADVNRYKQHLTEKYSQNTVRLSLASSSSFYAYLEAERYLDRSPFAHIKYPRKQYKKSIKTDQGSPVPVMSEQEYQAIVEGLAKKAQSPQLPREQVYERAARESARRLLPIVHMMGTYGLRIGDVLTVKVEEGERFSYRQKGGSIRQKSLRPMTAEILAECGMQKRQPFKGIAKSTVQGAIGRLTKELAGRSVIRHAYSCHDFRHFYAITLYQETQDVYALKEALGHATVSVTEIYLAGLGALNHG